MDVLDYFSIASIWSVLGFTLGFGSSQFINFCRIERAVSDLHDAEAGVKNGDSESNPGKKVVTVKSKRMQDRPAFGWVLIVLAVATVLQVAYYTNQQRQIALCQTEYNIDFANATTTRLTIAADDRQANIALIRATIEVDTTEERRAALDQYLETQRELEARRADNRLPVFPINTDCQ